MFVLCAVIAFAGGIVKLITEASGETHIAKAISSVVGAVLLLTFLQGTFENSLPEIKFEFSACDYQDVSNNAIKDIVEESAKIIENHLCDGINEKFGVKPRSCEISINDADFSVEYAKVVIGRNDTMISVYGIKNHVKREYGIDAEVVFE